MADTLDHQVQQLKGTVNGLKVQLAKLLDSKVLPFITRTEFRDSRKRLATAITLLSQQVESIQTSIESNVLTTITEQEAQALKDGALKVASVEADFRSVLKEISISFQDFQTKLNNTESGLVTRVQTLEDLTEKIESTQEIINSSFGTVQASVSALKSQLLYKQGRQIIDSSVAKK